MSLSCIDIEMVKNQHCSTFSIFQLMIPTVTMRQYPNIYDLLTMSSTYVINLHGQRLLSYHENQFDTQFHGGPKGPFI